MIKFDCDLAKQCEEYLPYLYELAARQYSDCPDPDALVQDSMLAFLQNLRAGVAAEHPKGLLSAIMKNKYNGWLREKYRDRILFFDSPDFLRISETLEADDPYEQIEKKAFEREEAAAVRREIGRLLSIYREAAVRYYVHGQTVEKIAADLHCAPGTVKSRLSSARAQIKKGLTNMETYSRLSYEPAHVSIGIWGNGGYSGEPFSLLHSPVEENLLVLAYPKPISVRELADTMGMPAAYLEPMAKKLVQGELLGKTAGGLVYTRCFLQKYEDCFGNIPAQESLAEKDAAQVWEIAWKIFAPLTEREECAVMSDKQKATLLLLFLWMALSDACCQCKPEVEAISPPERPNGGCWLAEGTVLKHGQMRDSIYDGSGPVHVQFKKELDGPLDCFMLDRQSVFGDSHWAYGGLKYSCSYSSILRFYASFLPCGIETDKRFLYDMIPTFEKLSILKRDENGKACLDIPALSLDEVKGCWKSAMKRLTRELTEFLRPQLTSLWEHQNNNVPKHVDCGQYYRNEGAVKAYPTAQLLSIVKKGLFPYPVTVGKTPLILVIYRKKEAEKTT